MEKLTVSKIVKVKDSKFGKNVMVKTNEHGDQRIYMIPTKNESSIREGSSYEGNTELWRKGDDVEFWVFKWPEQKAQPQSQGKDLAGELMDKLNSIAMAQAEIGAQVKRLHDARFGGDESANEPSLDDIPDSAFEDEK